MMEKCYIIYYIFGGSVIKNPPSNVGDTDLIPDLGNFPREGHGNPFQYSCLGNPMYRGVLGPWTHRELDRTGN